MKILYPVLAVLMSASSSTFAAGGPGSAFDPKVFGVGEGVVVFIPPPVGTVTVFAAPGGRRQRDCHVRVTIAAIDAEGDEVVVRDQLSRELRENDEFFFPLRIRFCRQKWPTTQCFKDDRRFVVRLKAYDEFTCEKGSYRLTLDVSGGSSPISKEHFWLQRGFGKRSVTTTGQFNYAGWGIYPAHMQVNYGLRLELEEVE